MHYLMGTNEMTYSDTLLSVENLNIIFPSPKGDVHAVKDVSFSLGKEKIGIVGESGSGKSVTGRAILRLLPCLLYTSPSPRDS